MISNILSVVSVIFIAVMLGIPLLIFYFNKSEKKKTQILSDKLKGYPEWIQNDVNHLKIHCVDRKYHTTMINLSYSIAKDERFKSADFACDNAFIKNGYFVYFEQNNNKIDTIDCYAVKISECSKFHPFYKKVISFKTTTTETPTKNASVVGRAVAGGLIAGGAGAVVGAISAQNKNMQNMQNPTTTTTTTTTSNSYRTAAITFNCCGVKQTIGLTGVYDNNFIEKINALKNNIADI